MGSPDHPGAEPPSTGGAGGLLQRQLHFVTGKGGVGKSVVACALALAFVRQGKRTLLVQVNAHDTHGPLLGIGPVPDEVRDVDERLSVVNTTPAASLKEYALLILRFEAVYRTVFENRVTKTFLRFVPSMAELTMLGKIWFHAEEKVDGTDGGRPVWDRIVVDTPSTGHGLKFLSVARVVRDASRIGPMYEKTTQMAAVLEDASRSALHVVTLPEELPVNETLELVSEVRRTRLAPLGALVLNNALPPIVDEHVAAGLSRLRESAPADDELRALLSAGERRRVRERLEAVERARLVEARLPMPLLELPHLVVDDVGRAEVERFADVFLRGEP